MRMQTNTTAGPATTIRLLHGSFVAGVVLFAIVTVLLIRPQRDAAGESIPANVVYALVGVSLAASAISLLFLRRRVPQRSTTDSANLYWTTAASPALLFWFPFEAAGLLGVVAYMLSGSLLGLGAAAIGVLGLLVFNPWQLERA